VATQEKVKLPVIYTSRRESDEFRGPRSRNLRLLRVPSYPKYDGNGEPAGFTPELVYEFSDGLLVVNEQMVERDVHFFEERARDRNLDFDGYSAEDTIRWLEEHEDFGLDFVRQADVAPPAGPLLEEITVAAMSGDLDRLVELHEQEEGSFARDEVLTPCRAAISRLEGLSAPQAENPGDGLSEAPAA
jgi:hypothetical protein